MLRALHDNGRIVISVDGPLPVEGDENPQVTDHYMSLETAVHLKAELDEAIDCARETRLVDRMREMMRLEKRK